MKSIEEAEIIEGTRVLVRVDWNLPIKDGVVLDTSRIEASLKTINYIIERGGKAILLSHLGDGTDSLEVVAKEAEKFFPNKQVRFVRDPWNCFSPDCKPSLEYLNNGGVAIVENLRFWAEVENDAGFAKKLTELGDVYVNEAFSVSHRPHTSIVQLPKILPAFAGFRFLEEYEKLSQALNPTHPFLFILGGAKFETKLPLVEKFLNIADNIFIGGANALPASHTDIANNSKIIFPIGEIDAMDANTETLALLAERIKEAQFVLWNGPLGNYEKGFVAGTFALARMIKDSGIKALIGGGDTENIIDEVISNEPNIFVSLGGGAMLDFLANGTLPGIEALS